MMKLSNSINNEARLLYEKLTKESAPKEATFDATDLAFLIAAMNIKKNIIKFRFLVQQEPFSMICDRQTINYCSKKSKFCLVLPVDSIPYFQSPASL